MSIEKYHHFLGKHVTLTIPDKGSVQGTLSSVRAGNTDPIFIIEALGQRLVIDALGEREFTLSLSDVGIPNTEPVRPEDSLVSIDNTDSASIHIEPSGLSDPSVRWALYIPPTQPGQLDANGEGAAPWGVTYWATLDGAIASLSMAARSGQIVFNDGRVAS